MEYEIKLKVFTLRLQKLNAKKNKDLMWSEAFDKFEGDDDAAKFNALFAGYISHFDGKFVTYKNWPKAMIVEDAHVAFKSLNSIFYGRFDGGLTNQTYKVKALGNDEDEITVDRNKVAAHPFYFLFYIPRDSNVGLLIVQSLNDASMHDILKLNFQKYIRSIDNSLLLNYTERITKEAIDRVKNGKVKSISVRKSGLSNDDGDSIFHRQYQDYGSVSIELKVNFNNKFPNARIIQDAKDYVMGTVPQLLEIESLESIGLDQDSDIFVNFEYNGKRATAKVSDGINLSPTYAVAFGDVPFAADNHPDPDKMKAYMLAFADRMIKEIGLA